MKKNERGKYLAKNTALFALGNIGTKMISFFLVPIYTNALSTSEYGCNRLDSLYLHSFSTYFDL